MFLCYVIATPEIVFLSSTIYDEDERILCFCFGGQGRPKVDGVWRLSEYDKHMIIESVTSSNGKAVHGSKRAKQHKVKAICE